MQSSSELNTVRRLLALVMLGLVVSGLTAFPLIYEINLLVTDWLGIPPDANPYDYGALLAWLTTVRNGLTETNAQYPWLAYGTDWLAFAHLILAALFWGPYRDPVKNIWVIEFGMGASLAVIPLALICGAIRGIPFFWQLIDCSFGLICFPLLWWARRLILTHKSKEDRMSGPPAIEPRRT